MGEIRASGSGHRYVRSSVRCGIAGTRRRGSRQDVLPLLSGDLRPEMVEALERVKAKFKTGCITNNLPANAIGSLGGRSLYIAEVMSLFDYVIESAKIGLTKTRSAYLSNDG